MADFTNLKRNKGLGAPPPPSEVKENLQEPETAPAPTAPVAAPSIAPQPAPEPQRERAARPKVVHLAQTPKNERDGRSARRTGRTVQFATRVSDDFDRKFRSVCKRDGLLMAVLLEEALEAYEKAKA